MNRKGSRFAFFAGRNFLNRGKSLAKTKKNMVKYTYFCGMHEACAVLRRVHILFTIKTL